MLGADHKVPINNFDAKLVDHPVRAQGSNHGD